MTVTFRHVVYHGPRLDLLGKTALLMPIIDDGEPVRWFAQFDDGGLPEAYGWRQFPKHDFTEYPCHAIG